MLPGAGDSARDLIDRGFVRALRERELSVDAIAVDAHLGHYLDHSLSGMLTRKIIERAGEPRHRRLWLMGISLGGMGALLYAREHAMDVEGIVLLAPFLGTRGTLAEIAHAGGLQRWRPGPTAADDGERLLLTWLQCYAAHDPTLPSIHLAYGTGDRFAPASAMLASHLPPGNVTTLDGGHDWPTWMKLWQRLLDRNVFANGRQRTRALDPK